jgi:hypothetical protein
MGEASTCSEVYGAGGGKSSPHECVRKGLHLESAESARRLRDIATSRIVVIAKRAGGSDDAVIFIENGMVTIDIGIQIGEEPHVEVEIVVIGSIDEPRAEEPELDAVVSVCR